MAQEYRDQGIPVYIFAHNIDSTLPFVKQRAARWREAAGVPPGTGATLPLVLVNAGRETTQNSHADFRKDYTQLIVSAGTGEPTAAVSSRWHKVNDNSIGVSVTVTNTGEMAFDPFEGGNDASVAVYAIERAKVIHLNFFAQHAEKLELPDVLKPGQGVTLETTLALKASTMKRMDILSVLEYRKSDGKWDLAQGARATEVKVNAPPVEPPVTESPHRIILPLLWRGIE